MDARGRDWQHPGENTASVRRFTAPREGRITITGRVYKAHQDRKTDGVRVAIRHQARDVWNAEIAGDDGRGVQPRLTLVVRKGDAVRFVVHKRGAIACDTTHWDPSIAYDDGLRLTASEGFSPRRAAEDPWSYEMEVAGDSPRGMPRTIGFRSDWSLVDQAATPQRAVALSDRNALPLAVIADGADASGLVLAVLDPGPWRLETQLTEEGRLLLRLAAGGEGPAHEVAPGESLRLPRVVLGAYRGTWPEGLRQLQAALRSTALPESAALGARLRTSTASAGLQGVFEGDVELDFWGMILADWQRQDGAPRDAAAFAAAARKHIDQARLLLADLRQGQQGDFLAAEGREIEQLAATLAPGEQELIKCRAAYIRLRALKRRIALANPLLGFGKLLFCKRVPPSYSHLVMQYFGWRARPGGGLFVLDQPGRSLACRDLFGPRLSQGSVLEPRLSYDAHRVVFSFVEGAARTYEPDRLDNAADEGFYHVFEAEVDGTGFRQLSRGPYEDLMPTYLPDGGIVFSSTRRQGYARCFGPQFSRRWHVYTLHRMDDDGGNLRALSLHDTNEWFPAVGHDGRILYSRWDYIDRDAVTHQSLWATRPDGTNPVAVWGNATASPHCTFQIQPIPNSHRLVFTASAHHSITAGSIAVVDPQVARDGHAAITRITPEVPFPEAEGTNIPQYYESPWPLSEKYFLVGYSPMPLVWEPGANPAAAVGIYLLDAAGNRELIYRDPAIGSTNPLPLVPRPVPPLLPSMVDDKADAAEAATGEMVLADVYQGLGNVPRGTITALRIVQIFPKTTHVANQPPIGLAGEENGRAILGTVPVEADGSARFVVPAPSQSCCRPSRQMGLPTRRCAPSPTYSRAKPSRASVATSRSRHRPRGFRLSLPPRAAQPSPIDPGELGGRPFSYPEVVQPVLDRHCVSCHGGQRTEAKLDLSAKPEGAFTRSYLALLSDRDFSGAGTNPKNAAEALVPRFGARNQIQRTAAGGMYGALGSRLLKLLRAGHEKVVLDPAEIRRLAAWIDLNAIFYGVNDPESQARQRAGEPIAMPAIQ